MHATRQSQMAFIDTKPPVAHSQGATPKVRKFSFSREEAARVVQAAFRGRLGRRNMRLRKVAKLMSLAVAGKTADSDEEGDVEGVMAQHLRFALRRRRFTCLVVRGRNCHQHHLTRRW